VNYERNKKGARFLKHSVYKRCGIVLTGADTFSLG